VTLFLHTGARRTRARRLQCAIWVLAALICTSWPLWAANLADLAGPLRHVAAMDRAGALGALDPLARELGVKNGRVLVEVRFAQPAAGQTGALTALGARVHRSSGNRVQAVVPLSRLTDLACLPTVAQVNLPERPVPVQIPPTVSEGVQLTNALSLQWAGLTGMGVSVAIIDQGFEGYPGAELPANVVARSFRSDGIIDGITEHGTACAEIVGDMAPNVDMYLLAVDTDMDAETALEWCTQNGIEIASMSLGWLYGPFDGTHALDEAVDRVRQSSALPVIASGNFAQRHWSGDYVDANANSLLEYDTQDEGISVVTTAAGELVRVYMSWFQTASPQGTKADVTDRDYDLELLDPTGVVIATSAVTQNGNDPPSEALIAFAGAPGTYDVRIRAMSPNIATGPTDHFELFCWTQDFDPVLQIPESSLSIPAAAAGALTIGATRAVADLPDPNVDFPVDTLEDFSSQGPTVDGRLKPDLSGPDAVQTSLGGTYDPFFGTSAAAPHVAGGAALLKCEDPTRTADELAGVLVRLATAQNLITPVRLTDSSIATPEQAGAGRLTLRSGLDTKPPTISITFPINGTTITTAQPTIVGVITDTETGVDQGTIVLTVDGSPVQWDSFNPGSGVVTYTPPSPLSRTAHTATLEASDLAGNAGTPAVTNFRVGLPTLSAGLHLISLPYRNLLNTNPSAIFGVALNELGVARWLPTDQGLSKYRIFPDPYASFEPPDCTGPNPIVVSPPAGLGYFVRLPREVVLNVAGEALTDVTSYTIRLPLGTADPTGWNMIGNPYQDKVDWSTVQFVTNGVRQSLDDAIASGVTEGIIFEYTGSGYDFVQPQSAVLKPWRGYWLHVNVSTAVIVYPTTVAAGVTAASKPEASRPAVDNWKAQIVASAAGLSDTCNYLGVAPNASSGHDVAADYPEPPAIGESVSLYFPHSDWGSASGAYTQDLRARAASAQEWQFDVACPRAGARVTLSWPSLNATVPGELALRLEDLATGRSVFMRGVTSYSYKASGVRHFRVTVERAGAGGLQITTLAAAPARDGSVVVTYELSSPAAVSAEVRNIAGRMVRGLVAGRNTPQGSQTLIWDARSDTGVRVPAGTYLLQLTARTADGQTVRRICPINAAR
jgi:subtilisin family serine protease